MFILQTNHVQRWRAGLLLGRNIPLVKQHNRAVVLRVLRRFGPISRRRMCEITRLQPATITNLVAGLMAEGLVQEVGSEQARSHQRRGGRRQVLVDLNPQGAFAVGVHIGVRLVTVAVGDLRGNRLCARAMARPRAAGPEATLQLAAETISDILQETAVDRSRVLGVGVASVGVVDPVEGVVRSAPQLGWRNVPVRQALHEMLGLPVVVDNSRRAMMLGEVLFGSARDARNAMVVHVATTIGAGLLIEHRLFYGDSYGAAQLGHLVVDPEGPLCACGGRGCLDAVAGELALTQRVREQVEAGRESLIPRMAEGALDALDARVVYAAALAGDALAREMVADVGRALGAALAHALVLVDPELVVVTGHIQETGDLFFGPLRSAVEPHVVRVLGKAPRIVPSTLGPDASAVSALSLALEHFFYGEGLHLETVAPVSPPALNARLALP
jgi:predicted NBD/HSP70 family sugar kinase